MLIENLLFQKTERRQKSFLTAQMPLCWCTLGLKYYERSDNIGVFRRVNEKSGSYCMYDLKFSTNIAAREENLEKD